VLIEVGFYRGKQPKSVCKKRWDPKSQDKSLWREKPEPGAVNVNVGKRPPKGRGDSEANPQPQATRKDYKRRSHRHIRHLRALTSGADDHEQLTKRQRLSGKPGATGAPGKISRREFQ